MAINRPLQEFPLQTTDCRSISAGTPCCPVLFYDRPIVNGSAQ